MDIWACPDGSNPSRSEDQCCASCDATEPVTEEPVECPPNCEMVCANGFVMEEGCPVCECVAAAVCVVEGVVYEDGAVWDDESGPCTQHTCVDGRVMTSMQSCVPPFLQEPCAGNAELVSVEVRQLRRYHFARISQHYVVPRALCDVLHILYLRVRAYQMLIGDCNPMM